MKANSAEPFLVVYGSDGTPIRTAQTFVSSGDVGHAVRRRGHTGLEFLVQRAFILSRARGKIEIAARAGIPLQAGAKNNVMDSAGAAARFLPLLRSLGATSICIQHVCFDGKFFDPLSALLARMVEQQYHTEGTPPFAPTASRPKWLLHLMDWVTSMPCVIHVMHNAAYWGVRLVNEADVQDRLFKCCESLRNSIGHLVTRIDKWVSRKACFAARTVPEDVHREMWRLLGVPPGYADDLARVGLMLKDGTLYLNSDLQHDPDSFCKVTHLLKYLFRIRKFNTARWMSLADSTQPMVCSLYAGLGEMAFDAISSGECGKYYLGGFEDMDAKTRRFCLVSAVGTGRSLPVPKQTGVFGVARSSPILGYRSLGGWVGA